ncbi:MAG: HAMP domain-containing sensor histidine kinase [Gemmatimonadaceae bacterium]
MLAAVATSILVGIVPAGIALNGSLGTALESRARDDVRMAMGVFTDHSATKAAAMMMYAKEFAHEPGLVDAMSGFDAGEFPSIAESAQTLNRGMPVIVGPEGVSWSGPAIGADLLERTRAGEMPVVYGRDGGSVWQIALAPVEKNGKWLGAAGFAVPLDSQSVGALASLTGTGVIVTTRGDNSVVATSLKEGEALPLLQSMRAAPAGSEVGVVSGAGSQLAANLELDGAGNIVFVRSLDAELIMLPRLKRVAMASAGGALLLALILGALIARRMAQPVALLAEAASAMAGGNFDAPLPQSRIREVARTASSFDDMRRALARRLDELRSANTALADAGIRLRGLQSDLLQRERLAATGRLVAQLAHEIRNPVANIRNCLELVKRRVDGDAEAREFTDLAIVELLRMHTLAEQVLDASRPHHEGTTHCSPVQVAREVAALSTAGIPPGVFRVAVDGPEYEAAAIPPDALKQVLLNLVQNGREAMENARAESDPASPHRIDILVSHAGPNIAIDVLDRGPGIEDGFLEKIFDPFFTTKSAVHGVGLGLFVAEGLVRGSGGELSAFNRDDGPGACFRTVLPVAAPPASSAPARPAEMLVSA